MGPPTGPPSPEDEAGEVDAPGRGLTSAGVPDDGSSGPLDTGAGETPPPGGSVRENPTGGFSCLIGVPPPGGAGAGEEGDSSAAFTSEGPRPSTAFPPPLSCARATWQPPRPAPPGVTTKKGEPLTATARAATKRPAALLPHLFTFLVLRLYDLARQVGGNLLVVGEFHGIKTSP